MYKIALCDDEGMCIIELSRLIYDYGHTRGCRFDIMGFECGSELLAKELGEFDIFFLDIEMPDMSGLTVAERIKEANPHALVVFITWHGAEYINDAFRLKAFQFLYKPIVSEKLNLVLDSALHELNFAGGCIVVNDYKNSYRITATDITYVHIDVRKTIIETENKIYRCDDKIDDVVSCLSERMFARVYHKKYVNLKYVKYFNKEMVVLKKGDYERDVPLSRRMHNSFAESFRAFAVGQ